MNNRSAAGQRRSAIAARIRLREEWSELKGPEEPSKTLKEIPEIVRKQQKPVRSASKLIAQKVKFTTNKNRSPKAVLKKHNQNVMTNVPISDRNMDTSMEALRGVVALVDVGTETRALALRAALMALGSTVVPAWSPFVTHFVWSQGGCRDTRARARALGCYLVSPLWVEACASCGRRVAEGAFPAAARASDLPSPRALRIMLKRAEAENIPLADLLSKDNPQRKSGNQDKQTNKQRLRISSGTDHDTSADTTHDTTADTTTDTSTGKDTSRDRSKDSTDPTIRVNTLPRGGRVAMATPAQPKSRRKLFTQKEADLTDKEDDGDEHVEREGFETSYFGAVAAAQELLSKHAAAGAASAAPDDGSVTGSNVSALTESPVPKRTPSKLSARERKDLARAERMARRMLGAATPKTHTQILSQTDAPRVVLTGMSRTERQAIHHAVKSINGRVQKLVDHRTTHVVLGSCISDGSRPLEDTCSKITSTNTRLKIPSTHTSVVPVINTRTEIPGINTRADMTGINTREIPSTNTRSEIPSVSQRCGVEKARTLNALLGAARGCRVVYAQWVLDSLEVKKWLHHHGYEVTHLRKISQKARVERTALGRICADYAYDVFRGMRVLVSTYANQRDAAIQLLTLCGGRVQNGGSTQNGAQDCDVCVGNGEGEVSSKWVFDSVAAGRMRTTRRYVNLVTEEIR